MDNDGHQADPLAPASSAAIDGVAAAAMLQLIIGVTVALLVATLRYSLDTRQEAQWEHELR